MKRTSILLVLLFLGIANALAQDWVDSTDSDREFNCELIEKMLEDYGDEPYAREDGETQTFAEFHSDIVPECTPDAVGNTVGDTILFKVTTRSSVNLRDCSNTSCDLVGKTEAGDVLDVIAEDGDWYEIKFDSKSAFIAGWLTLRLPDAILETDEPYTLIDAGCLIVPDSSRSSDMDINFILTGERKDDATADLYLPDHEKPLRVDRQLDKTFIDTGDSYVLQTYYWNTWFPTGVYTIELAIDGEIHVMAWNVEERAQYNIFVLCE